MHEARPSKRRQARAGVRPPTLRDQIGEADPDDAGLVQLCKSVSRACDTWLAKRGIVTPSMRDAVRASAIEAGHRNTATAVESPVMRDALAGRKAPPSSVRHASGQPRATATPSRDRP